MAYQIELKQVSSAPVLVVRRRTSIPQLPKVVPDACGAVWNFVRASGIKTAGRHVALYLNDKMDIEVGVEVGSDAAAGGEVVLSSTPGGTVATATHFGPYNQLKQAHDAVQQWCTANGHKVGWPCWEVYDHWKDEWNSDPSKIRTDVYYVINTPAK